MRYRFVAVALVAALCAGAVSAYANDTAVGGGAGDVKPLSSTDVRMESETIQATLYDSYALFRVDFRFVNDGEAQGLELGFPFRVAGEEETDAGSSVSPAAGFRVWVNGNPTGSDYMLGSDGPDPVGYFVHEVWFDPGETMVTVEYVAAPGGSSASPPQDVARPEWANGLGGYYAWHEYWVHTGAGWAGDIGATVARFTLSDDFRGWGIEEAIAEYAESLRAREDVEGEKIALSYTVPDDSSFQWVYRDYEPTPDPETLAAWSPYDLRLPYYMTSVPFDAEGVPSEQMARVIKDVEASSELTLGEYEYPAYNAFAGIPTAWAEAAKGDGAGEWAKVTWAAKRDIEEVRVMSGYGKRPELFYKYNRPKTLKITFSDGTETTLALEDHPGLQTFPVEAKSSWMRVEIGEVYRGTTRDETYISMVDAGARSPEFLTYAELMAQAGIQPEETASTDEVADSTEAAEEAEEVPPASESPDWLWVGVLALAIFVGVVGWVMFRRAQSAPGGTSDAAAVRAEPSGTDEGAGETSQSESNSEDTTSETGE